MSLSYVVVVFNICRFLKWVNSCVSKQYFLTSIRSCWAEDRKKFNQLVFIIIFGVYTLPEVRKYYLYLEDKRASRNCAYFSRTLVNEIACRKHSFRCKFWLENVLEAFWHSIAIYNIITLIATVIVRPHIITNMILN